MNRKRLIFILAIIALSVILLQFGAVGMAAADDKVVVTDIEYRYRPLGEEPFFLREVKRFKSIPLFNTDGYIELLPGERIADHQFNIAHEASFIFYSDDRGLAGFFSEITASQAQCDNKGRLQSETIEGVLLNPVSPGYSTYLSKGPLAPYTNAKIIRHDFKYDGEGRKRSYQADIYYGPHGPWYGVTVYSIDYDKQGRVVGLISGDGTYGYWQKYKFYNIVYNSDNEIISYSAKFLSAK